jgi:uncharacterized OsmC-like protein
VKLTKCFYSLGDLRTEAVHLESGDRIHTDAPKDNEGKGEAFSPTDLMATSLASCMITVMGIKARQHNIDMDGTKADIVKEMGANPRRISVIKINVHFPKNYSEKEKILLERTAHTCPVGNSLCDGLEEDVNFHYPEEK